MARRITCYVVFVTLIWGAHTVDEEKVRDVFKSNMTRNDFSNLLQTLIKLNENRVSVLQKLYRLEDYGVLSEVLRSGEKKIGNGNPNDLYLIVMSKKPNDPLQRKADFQVVDSITSLDAGNDNIHPRLDFVLDPAGYISQNNRKENRLESIFGNVPRVYEPTRKHRADDESKKITTTTKTLNYDKPGLRTEVKHDKIKTSFKSNEDKKHHKKNSRFEIVSNTERRPTAREKLLDYDGNSNKYPQTVGYNSQSNEYLDFTIENDKLTTKSIIVKHILSSNHKNSMYPLEGKDENHKNSKYPLEGKDEDDYSSKLHGNNHHNPKTNKYTPKVKFQSNQQNYKLTTKPIIIKHILSSNHKNSKYPLEGKETVGYYSQSNEYFDFTIENKKLTTKPIIIKHILSSNHKNSKYPLEGKGELDEDDYSSLFSNNKNDHKRPYISNKKLHGTKHHNPKTNKYTPKVKVQSNQQNYKLTTKPIIIKHILSSNHINSKYPLEGKGTVGYYSQSNEYFDFTIENDKLTTKPIIIKHILSSNHKNSKYPLEGKDELDEDDYGSPFSTNKNDHTSQYISSKKLYGNNHHISKTNKYTPKVKVQHNQQNDKLTTKPTKHIKHSNHKKSKYPLEGKDELDEGDYGSPFSNTKNDHKSPYISNKKLHGSNHHNPKTKKYTLKVQSNQKNYKLTTKPIIKQIKHILSSNHKTSKYPLEGKDELDEDDYGSPFSNNKNNHKSPYISNKKLHGNNHHNPKTNKYTPKVKVLSNQQNDKLTIKPIIIKHILSSNHKKSKYPLEGKDELDGDDYGSLFSNNKNDHNGQYTKMDSDITTKRFHVNNHHNPKTNKNTPKVKVQSNQQNNNLMTEPTIKDIFSSNLQNTMYPLESKYEQDEVYYVSPFSNIENYQNSPYTNINSDDSTKKLHDVNNHNNPKTNKNIYNIPKIKVQSNQPSKLNQYKSNLNNQGIKHYKIKTPIDIETTTRKKYYKINGTVNNSSEYKYSIKNSNLIHANKHDHKDTKIKHIYNATKEIDNNNKFLTTVHENVYGSKPVIPETTKDTQYGSYPNFEDHKDVRDNSNKDEPKTAEDTPGNYPGLAHHNDVIDNKDKPNTTKELRYGDNLNAESKKDIDYDGVKMFDNGKKSSEKFTILITNVGNGTAEEVEQQNYPKLILNAFDQPEGKPILRKPFEKCLYKKASKLCSKSCISAYKNVCQRLKCTSRSKRELKTECKRSCKKTFASSSSKYSDDDSDEYSDESYSDGDY